LVLFLGYICKFLVFVEESIGSWDDLSIINTPDFTKGVHDVHLSIHDFDGSLLSNIGKSDDTILDSLSLDELEPSNFRSAVTMGTTTGFLVNSFNVNNSQFISWDYTTLI
jgi:hypothetical protein